MSLQRQTVTVSYPNPNPNQSGGKPRASDEVKVDVVARLMQMLEEGDREEEGDERKCKDKGKFTDSSSDWTKQYSFEPPIILDIRKHTAGTSLPGALRFALQPRTAAARRQNSTSTTTSRTTASRIMMVTSENSTRVKPNSSRDARSLSADAAAAAAAAKREFSIASTVSSTIGKATSLIAGPLSLIASGVGAGGTGESTELLWPNSSDTFAKIKKAIDEERNKRMMTNDAAEEKQQQHPKTFKVGPTVIELPRWVVIVGSNQAQAQRVATRLMRLNVKRVSVLRGSGFGNNE
mmetsp:Transcript_24761/g.44051  ORF Transcript_24761/g.44051 Transcript_24761/m.44051 type:complete len:293 (+) Transcript_24761:418-1296(+)